jgi:hypothetical protein
MRNRFNINESEKKRIKSLYNIKEEDFVSIRGYDSDYTEDSSDDVGRCENCDRKFQWKEVPSGWDEEYCDECNEEYNTYECRNCREEVDTPDSWCSKECYKEYHQ